MNQRVLVTGANGFIEELAAPTVVTDRSGMKLCEIEPVSFDEAPRRAVAEDVELRRLTATRAGAS